MKQCPRNAPAQHALQGFQKTKKTKQTNSKANFYCLNNQRCAAI